jgi:hypothetical protein
VEEAESLVGGPLAYMAMRLCCLIMLCKAVESRNFLMDFFVYIGVNLVLWWWRSVGLHRLTLKRFVWSFGRLKETATYVSVFLFTD